MYILTVINKESPENHAHLRDFRDCFIYSEKSSVRQKSYEKCLFFRKFISSKEGVKNVRFIPQSREMRDSVRIIPCGARIFILICAYNCGNCQYERRNSLWTQLYLKSSE